MVNLDPSSGECDMRCTDLFYHFHATTIQEVPLSKANSFHFPFPDQINTQAPAEEIDGRENDKRVSTL